MGGLCEGVQCEQPQPAARAARMAASSPEAAEAAGGPAPWASQGYVGRQRRRDIAQSKASHPVCPWADQVNENRIRYLLIIAGTRGGEEEPAGQRSLRLACNQPEPERAPGGRGGCTSTSGLLSLFASGTSFISSAINAP